MAKHKGKGRVRKTRILKGNIDEEFSLGTLAAATLLSSALSDNVDEEAFLLSTECVYSLRNHTAGEGPIIVGWAHNDYTDAEIEAYIENTQGWSRGDLIQQEIAKRFVRIVGIFSGESTDEVLNDGKMLKTPMRFNLVSAKGLDFWAYNDSGGTLTTGAVVAANGHAWLKSR